MDKFNCYLPLVARVLLALLFLLAGLGKIGDVAGTAGYMSSVGIPGFLAWPAIIFEIGVGVLLIVGWKTRIVALAAAAFCLVTAVLFHNNFADQIQMIMFLKNLSIAGGFLLLTANGAGKFAIDK